MWVGAWAGKGGGGPSDAACLPACPTRYCMCGLVFLPSWGPCHAHGSLCGEVLELRRLKINICSLGQWPGSIIYIPSACGDTAGWVH